ncbi:Uu.00g029440.m01.CDS01 [Anthostomella pinea]|uniref:Uu.00g029440.m01.CDS01 n=1 Tax=Anthostomella pinea TaxID=933095 RepID=A0AAI8V845_9PEZI|nr:Uu.00g029440.m01.CDS01 [Anthostomella pinea]
MTRSFLRRGRKKTVTLEKQGEERASLTTAYDATDPLVDIVAVHGLNGDARKTFTDQNSGTFWLGDEEMLPRDLRGRCRVLTYGYPSSVASILGKTSSDRILQHATTLVAELVADRELEDAQERPIIFLCHSLGGIIVKRALVYSAHRTGRMVEHLHSIYTSTYGIMFFGTPHQGSASASLGMAAQRMIEALVPSKLIDTNGQLLSALREGSEVLQDITDNFTPLIQRFRVYFFWEQEKTDFGVKYDYVVTESSAAPILDNTDRAGLRIDHRNMLKFASRNSPGYKLIVANILRYSREAPATISRRWISEKELMNSIRRNESMEAHPIIMQGEDIGMKEKS